MLLTILIMPFSPWEAILAASVVTAAVGRGLSQNGSPQYAVASAAQAFVLVTTAVVVICISYLQSVLRRRAFDSSFEVALQAAQLHEASATDALTGGYNRRHMEEALASELTRSARFGRPLSVIMFDLDNFKAVNDTLGHAAGDDVLRVIHDAAQEALREVDTIARFGGDEFLILLPETDTPAGRGVAQRLRTSTNAALRNNYGSNSLETKVTLSMGLLTVNQEEPMPAAEAISRVDGLLYEAKRGGKNRVAVG
jgi:diguanylate cyclase (GGDEF)-like protein